MNEELQSMNEELQTTNEALRERTGEVDRLNRFMESVLGGLNAAIVVVGPDMQVRFWNRQAHDLWGLREDEAVGHHLFELDSGIPVAALGPPLLSVLSEGLERRGLVVEAVNRRGRTVNLQVRVSPLVSGEGQLTGAMVMMEPNE